MKSMLVMPSQLDLYESICALSGEMVIAARENDWEELIALERRVVSLRDALLAGNEAQNLDSADNDRKRSLIQRILDHDAEIRRHTEPWMEHVRHYLGVGARQRRVETTYRQNS